MSDIVIDNFKKVFKEDIIIKKYDKENDNDINEYLKKKPEENTIIFIKEKLRCSKTLYKKYLGIIYERHTKSPDDAVIIQGLLGRITGYDDNIKSKCFTNINSIDKYNKLWDSNFENKKVDWKSKTTIIKNHNLQSKGTYNNPLLIKGMNTTEETFDEIERPKIIKKKSFDEIKEYFNKNLKNYGRGPKKRITNVNGFYECMTQHDKENKVRDINEFNEMEKNNSWGFRGTTDKSKDKNKYRHYYCYEDKENNETLSVWLVWY
jgi:hypothetical protein